MLIEDAQMLGVCDARPPDLILPTIPALIEDAQMLGVCDGLLCEDRNHPLPALIEDAQMLGVCDRGDLSGQREDLPP